MDATTKVYLSVCFLVLVIGFYFHRVPRDLNHQDIYDSFQGVFPDVEGYDYFYLVLQWPPSFCNTGSYKCHENATKLTSFTIHGLWPQKEKGVPVICTSGPAFDFRKLQNDTKLIKRMETFWPNLEARKTDEVFWKHEWDKHGRCIGLDQNVYFNRSVNVYDTKNISSLVEELKKHGIQAGESYTIENYTEAIQKTFHIVRPTIQSNNGRIYGLQLLEIRLCVEKSGTNLKNCGHTAFPKWDEISDVHFQLPRQN